MDAHIVQPLTDSPFAALTFIAAPALLTNAASVLLLGTSNRLARAVDRVRIVAERLDHHASPGSVTDREVGDLERAERRVRVIVSALTAFYLAVAAFAFSTMVALLGASFLSPGETALLPVVVRTTIASAVVGVASIVFGSLSLVFESRLTFALLHAEADVIRRRYIRR